MDINESLTYLQNFVDHEKTLRRNLFRSIKMDRMVRLLEMLDHPEEKLKVVHVAGSKGKGSTCALIAAVCASNGYKTGLYTSPHICDCRERIRIVDDKDKKDDQDLFPGQIDSEKLAQLMTDMKPALDQIQKEDRTGGLSFFEVFTALALLYLSRERVDIAVVEVGLGGRLDATNAIPADICVITPIGREHQAILGETLTRIAGEKAAIIKESTKHVVISEQPPEAMDVVLRRCQKFNIKPVCVGRELKDQEWSFRQPYSQISFKLGNANYDKLSLKLIGRHQMMNAATALACLPAIKALHLRFTPGAISDGLKKVFWPCRFEMIAKDPAIVLDAAHSVESTTALCETLQDVFPDKNIRLIWGVSEDKNIKEMAELLSRDVKSVIVTKAQHPRAKSFSQQEVDRLFPGKGALYIKNLKEAIETGRAGLMKEDVLLITGSLFLASEARKYLMEKEYVPV